MSKTLLYEIKNVSLITLILGVLQILITVPAGYFGLPAILGTAAGCFVALLNFTLMGLILEKCMNSMKAASGLAGFGYILRLCIIAAVVVWAMKVSYLNYVCVIIPLIFPQLSIFIINIKRRRDNKHERT